MPNSYTNYVEHARWDHVNKVQSRIDTIVQPYRAFFKRESLPDGRQYWTICGAHFDENGKLDGEYGQLVKEGLIAPSQFYGVDKEESIIVANRVHYPSVHWLHGDFLENMEEASVDGRFFPAVINFDNIRRKEFGAEELKQMMKFIDDN